MGFLPLTVVGQSTAEGRSLPEIDGTRHPCLTCTYCYRQSVHWGESSNSALVHFLQKLPSNMLLARHPGSGTYNMGTDLDTMFLGNHRHRNHLVVRSTNSKLAPTPGSVTVKSLGTERVMP